MFQLWALLEQCPCSFVGDPEVFAGDVVANESATPVTSERSDKLFLNSAADSFGSISVNEFNQADPIAPRVRNGAIELKKRVVDRRVTVFQIDDAGCDRRA